MNTTTTQQGSEGFSSYLLATSKISPEQFLELQEEIADMHISQHLNQMVLAGVIDIYTYKSVQKAKTEGIYKQATKFCLNRIMHDAAAYRTYLNRFEKEYLCELLGSTTPAHLASYTNSGNVMVRLQNKWRNLYGKQLNELYVVFRRKAEHYGSDIPDFMACIEMTRFAASMVIEDARVTYDRVKELATRRWKVKEPDFSKVKAIISRCEQLQQAFYKGDPHDGFLNTQLAKLGQAFVENVYLASQPEALENIVIAAIMDYTDFYIAHTIELLQQDKLNGNVTKSIREDFANLDAEPEPFFQDFLNECKSLADYLPQYEDIEDLKETISEVNEDIILPPTPMLDKFRKQVIYVRRNGRPNDKKTA